jgi:ATPase subunit of ABC transporter with duplicated ATPase domains
VNGLEAATARLQRGEETVPAGAGALDDVTGLKAATARLQRGEEAAAAGAAALERTQRLGAAGGRREADAEALEDYSAALEEMDRLGGWSFEEDRAAVLAALRLPGELLARDVRQVSGGEAARVQLAGLLLSPANVLLLDEPSNNLDAASLRFLVEWLRRSEAAVLLVSHDSWLLDAITTETVEIDEASKGLRLFAGSSSAAAMAKQHERAEQLQRVAEAREKVGRLRQSANRLAGLANRSQNLSANDYFRARGKKVGRKARVQRERIERAIAAIEQPALPAMPRFAVAQPARGSGTLVSLDDVSYGFGPDAHRGSAPGTKGGLTLHMAASDRVAITGPNGAGKSTLLRLLAGELEASRGGVWRAPGTRVAFLRQTPSVGAGMSLLAFGCEMLRLPDERVRELIGRVIFGDAALIRTGELSLGQLRRVELSLLFASAPDLLLLDEPTNHVDLQTIEMLERALDEYRGAAVVASHDEGFLRRLGIERRVALG